MTVYDDIDRKLENIPLCVDDLEITLMAVSAGILLFPLVRVEGSDAVREFMIKLTATLVRGIERLDAEIEAAKDGDHP